MRNANYNILTAAAQPVFGNVLPKRSAYFALDICHCCQASLSRP